MTKILFVSLLILAIAPLAVHCNSDDSDDIVRLDASNFSFETSKGDWVIMFHSSCQCCKELKPTWDELAVVEKDSVNVATVNW